MEGARVALAPGPTPSPGGGSPDSDAGRDVDLRRVVGRASITPHADPRDGSVTAGTSASGSSAFSTPIGHTSPHTPSPLDDDLASWVPTWAWVPRGTEVFALADPKQCKPYMSPPVEAEETRSPHVAEPLYFVENRDENRDEGAASDDADAWRLGQTAEGSEFAGTIKDSTTVAFEVRARADWHASGRGGVGSAAPSPVASPASSASTTPRASVRYDDVSPGGQFSFLTPSDHLNARSKNGQETHGTPATPGFGGVGATGASGSNVDGANITSAAPPFASLSLKSAFTKKYLQARKKPPHVVQFYSDRRGLYETWELVGGASGVGENGEVDGDKKWRPWGICARGIDTALREQIGATPIKTPHVGTEDSPSIVDDETVLAVSQNTMARCWSFLFTGTSERNATESQSLQKLGGRSFCVVRSRRSPNRALLLVRLRLPTGESPGFDSPGVSSSARTPHRRRPPRHSAPSSSTSFSAATPPPTQTLSAGMDKIRDFSPGSASSSKAYVSRGASPGTSQTPHSIVDAMDVMAMSGKLLKGFALKPEAKRRRSSISSSFHAWREVVESVKRLQTLTDRAMKAWANRWVRKSIHNWRILTVRRSATRVQFAQAMSDVASKTGTRRFAGVALRTWRDVALASGYENRVTEAHEHKAEVFNHTKVMRNAFSTWRVRTQSSLAFLFSQRRAEAFANGLSRRKRREAFRLWRSWTVPDTKRRILATHDATLARNESKALFTALRHSIIKETQRVCLTKWQKYVARLAIGKAHKVLADKMLKRSKSRRVFSEWRNGVLNAADLKRWQHETADRHYVVAEKVKRRAQYQNVIQTWRSRVVALKNNCANEKRALVFYKVLKVKNLVPRTFHMWASQARMTHYRNVKIETSARREERAYVFKTRLDLRMKRQVLKSWRETVRKQKHVRTKVVFLIGKRIRNVTSPVFSAWRDVTVEIARRNVFSQRVVVRKIRQLCVLTLDAWRDAVHSSKVSKKMQQRAILFSVNLKNKRNKRDAFDAFVAWVDAFRYRKSVAVFVRLAKNRTRRRSVTQAISLWKTAVATARALRAAGVVAVARDLRRSVRSRFDVWSLWTCEQQRVASSRVRFLEGRRAQRVRLSVRHAFQGWHETARVHRQKVDTFITNRNLKRFGVVLRLWRVAARSSRFSSRAEGIISRKLGVYVAKTQRDVVVAWHREAHINTVARRRASRFAKRHERLEQRASFNLWRSIVADVNRARLAVDATLRRRASNFFSNTFENWCVTTRVARRVRLASRAITKRRNVRVVSNVFQNWFVIASETRHKRRVLTSLLTKKSENILRDTFKSWCQLLNQSKRTAHTLQVFKKRRLEMTVRITFKLWLRNSKLISKNKSETLRSARLFEKITTRRLNTSKRSVLKAWSSVKQASIRDQFLLQKIANRWSKLNVSESFDTWRDVSRSQIRERFVLTKIATRWAKLSLVRAFHTWHDYTIETGLYTHLVAKSLRKRAQGVLRGAFGSWRVKCISSRKEKLLILKIATRWQKASIVSSFKTWFEELEDSKRTKFLMAKIANRWSKLLMTNAFDAWYERRAAIRKHSLFVAKQGTLFKKVKRRKLRTSFEDWHETVTQIKQQRVHSTQVAARWIEDTKSAVVMRWRSVAKKSKRAERIVKRLRDRRATRALLLSVKVWHHWFKQSKSFKFRVLKNITRSNQVTFTKAWAGWFQVIKHARAVDSAVVGRVSHFARRVRRRKVSFAFAAMKRNCAATLHAWDAAGVLIQHWVRRRVAVRFRTWRDVVYRGAYLRALQRRFISRRWQWIARQTWRAWRSRVKRSNAFPKKSEIADGIFYATRRRALSRSWSVWMKWVDTTVHLKLRGDKERVEWMVSATESERAQKQQLAKDLESSKKVTDLLTAQIEGIQLECVSLRAAVEERTVEANTLRAVITDRDQALAQLMAERDVVRGWREARDDTISEGQTSGDPKSTLKKITPKQKHLEWAENVESVAGEVGASPMSPPAMRTAYAERRTPEIQFNSLVHDETNSDDDATDGSDDDASVSDSEEPTPNTRIENTSDHASDEDLPGPDAFLRSALAQRNMGVTVDAATAQVPSTPSPVVDEETVSSPPTSAGSRLDRALRLGAVQSAKVKRKQVSSAENEKRRQTPVASSPPVTATPRRVSRSSPTVAPRRRAEASHPAHLLSFFAQAASRREASVAKSANEETDIKHTRTAPITYAHVRPFIGGVDSKANSQAVFPVDSEGEEKNSSLGDAVDIALDRGGVRFRKTYNFHRVFWAAEESGEESATALGRTASETAAPMVQNTRNGIDSTIFAVGGAGGGKTVLCDSIVAALGAQFLTAAAKKNERLDRLDRIASENLNGTLKGAKGSSSQNMTTRVCVSVSMYESRGLVVDDLLADHGGNQGMRLRPRALSLDSRLDTHRLYSGTTTSHDSEPGLAYDVEDGLTRIAVTSAEDTSRLLALGRDRRGGGREDGRNKTSNPKTTPDSCITEWWFETVTVVTSAAFGVRSRVSRSARARVVDVHDGSSQTVNVNGATFALAQCAGRLAGNASGRSEKEKGQTIDWRQSALLKLSKAPLTGEGALSVVVSLGSSDTQAESAQTGLRFANAVRRLAVPAGESYAQRYENSPLGTGDAATESRHTPQHVSRSVDPPTSRRDALAQKLARVSVEARRNV